MKKISIRTAFCCARTDFCKWLLNSRMIILAVLAVFIYMFAVQPLRGNAELMDEPLNLFEPYIAALNSGSLLLIIPLGFLVISSDFPKIDGNVIFSMIRMNRINWFIGQIIGLVMMCAAYMLFIFAVSVGFSAMGSVPGTDWSDVTHYFSTEFPEYSFNFGALLLPKNLYNQLSLSASAVQSTAFVFVYLLLFGLILLFFTIIGRKKAGVVVCGGIIAAGSALCSINAELMWALPMANSIVWLHFTEFRRESVYPVLYSAIYFAAIIAVLTALCVIMLRRSDCFVNGSERE